GTHSIVKYFGGQVSSSSSFNQPLGNAFDEVVPSSPSGSENCSGLISYELQQNYPEGDTNIKNLEACLYEQAIEVSMEVNSWAEKETNGLIKEVLPAESVDGSTRLIFANAIYFKGAWNEKFDAQMSKDHDFHLLDGSSVKALFMVSYKRQLISAFDGFKGEDKRHFSMYMVLPDAMDGVSALLEKVSFESGFLERKLPHQKVLVGDFRIPKVHISFELEASNVLKELGVVLPFKGGDLTEMVNSFVSQNLYVFSIYHKSFVEVNEDGTEAAAASVVTMKLTGSVRFPTRIDFVADHPFLFLIREDLTGTVLFIGSLNSNSFIGRIPHSIGNLSNLYWLDLADNELQRPIPISNGSVPSLDNLHHAKHFHLGKNNLSGNIPPQLFSSEMALIHL
ncbi:hypothetical protein HN873_035295, partial [Arachis hypogaea]